MDADRSAAPPATVGPKLGTWLTVGGVGLLLLGAVALYLAVLTTYASVIVFGALLAAGGLLQVALGVWTRGEHSLVFYLLTGAVAVFAGVSLLVRPTAGVLALTLLLAGFFVAMGVWRVTVAVLSRDLPGRGWAIGNGIVTLALGLIIGMQWPESALWAIGVIVGVDLVATGAAQLVTGLALRRALHAAPGFAPPAPGAA